MSEEMTKNAAPVAEDLPVASLDTTDLAQLTLLDPGDVDWQRVARTAYLVHQHLRYVYPGPIADLQQQLMILPPPRHGDQRRIMHRLDASPAPATRVETEDPFGNTVISLHLPGVERAVDFEAWIVIERRPAEGPLRLPGAAPAIRRLLESTSLTSADSALRAVAAELIAAGEGGAALAARIGAWTHGALRYEHGATDIHTTAAQALAIGRGVCQDYAHVMLALCRLCGLPARYVSGHLLGEGGTHAWVETLLPDPERPHEAIVWPYDPANGCVVDLRYLTIAVGRDYRDVAPTSGTFRAAYAGALQANKSVGLTEAEYAPASRQG
jgi:transglutaminase-like putative cysteine protease